jgi:ATP-dependent Clp protease adaptor protein ClpS
MSKKKPPSNRGLHRVVLQDDNHNTFDDVIDSLMEVCGHGYLQSVQCATITHSVGRCSIFEDSYDSCQSIHHRLMQCGLTVIVEKCEKKSSK